MNEESSGALSAFLGLDPIGFLPCILFFAAALSAMQLWLRCTVKARAPSPVDAQRHLAVDGLRGFLAMGVLMHHYMSTYRYQLSGRWDASEVREYALIGPLGVAMFFMITGFLFWQRVLTRRGALDWRQLAISRLFRIVPLYAAAVAALLVAILFASRWTLSEPLWQVVAEIAQWMFLGTPDINGVADTYRAIAGVTWTLRYELLFYSVLPALAWMLRSRRAGPWMLAGIATIAVVIALLPSKLVGSHPRYLVFFLLGALSAHAYGVEALRTAARSRAASHVVVAMVLLLFGFCSTVHGALQNLLLFLIFLPIALGNSIYGLLCDRSSVQLGKLSYGIYLLHGLVLYFLFSIAFDDFFRTASGAWPFWSGLALTVVLVLIASQLAYRFIEEPCIRLGRRLDSARREHDRLAFARRAPQSAMDTSRV